MFQITDAQAAGENRKYIRCKATAHGREWDLIFPSLPASWERQAVAFPQPVDLLAIGLGGNRLLVIRLRWLPSTPHYPAVSLGESLLGGLGVDVAALDRVRDGAALRASEADSFYEVLAATKQIGPHQLARFARGNLAAYAAQWNSVENSPDQPELRQSLAAEALRVLGEERYPIAPLFNDAVNQRGELYVFEGVARRALVIETAADADASGSVSQKWGVQRYYEIEVFTPDSQNLPLVFCMLEVPHGFPLGDDIRTPVRVAGFSFKRWAFHTRRRSASGADDRLLAPLLIGRAPILLEDPAGPSRSWGLVFGGAFALALGAVCWIVWRTNRSDARFERDTRSRLATQESEFDPARLAKLDLQSDKSE